MSHYTHGAVSEDVKQSYLDQMLDYYKNTEMQHMLMPEEYSETIQLPFLSNTPPDLSRYEFETNTWEPYGSGSVPETTKSGTRYVTAPIDRPEGMPEHLSYGDVGPDYITMMNIMKAQADPNFNIGFMTDEFMRENPDAGAYFRSDDQTVAFNPRKMLDWSDPRVLQAFAQKKTPPSFIDPPGTTRNYDFLSGTSLDFSDDWNKNVVAHELGHYGSLYGRNRPGEGITSNKFKFPNVTRDINMTKFYANDPAGISDPRIRDVQGHNMAYWVGRAHDWYGDYPDRDMYLTKEGAQNYGAWKHNAQQYIDRGGPEPVETFRPNMRDVAGPVRDVTRPAPDRTPGRHHFNTGGLVSLVL